MITDPIGNYLTKIRNAIQAKHTNVEVPLSKMKASITEVLQNKGYIKKYTIDKTKNVQGAIHIVLKYADEAKKYPAITKLISISKPSLRKDVKVKDIPNVLNGLGVAILSTSKGIITDKEAKQLNVGGQVICYIY